MPFVDYQLPQYDDVKSCNSSEHDPPKYIVLDPGIHVWQCPVCEYKQSFIVSKYFLNSQVAVST
jgi:hypothetical protein